MIYKGVCKNMIVLKNTGSDIFEEAYFIINDKNPRTGSLAESDMISEANKLVSKDLLSCFSGEKNPPVKEKRSKGMITFLCGFASGVLILLLVTLLR